MHKILRIFLFVFLAFSTLSVFSPFTFTNVWVRNYCYMGTVILSLIIGLQMKAAIHKYLLIYLPFFFFLALYILSFNSFADRRTDMWRTSFISHRKGSSYMGEQMLNAGARGYARRTVKVISLAPLCQWVTKADTLNLDKSWIRVNEDYNPYELK